MARQGLLTKKATFRLRDDNFPIHRIQTSPSMRRQVDVKSVFFPLLEVFLVFERSRLCRHPSIRTLLERFSLGASWAYSFQQVLLPDNRPRLPSLRRKLGQDLVAVT